MVHETWVNASSTDLRIWELTQQRAPASVLPVRMPNFLFYGGTPLSEVERFLCRSFSVEAVEFLSFKQESHQGLVSSRGSGIPVISLDRLQRIWTWLHWQVPKGTLRPISQPFSIGDMRMYLISLTRLLGSWRRTLFIPSRQQSAWPQDFQCVEAGAW